MSSTKIPKDIDEMREDSSDNESVLEKPKKATVAKEKKPYVVTENRRLNCEKMREARNVNVEKRRELKAIEDQKSTAEKALVEKLTHKKMQKTQKQIKVLEILKNEISDHEEEAVVEKKAPKKAVAKKVVKKEVVPKKVVKKTEKVVYESESESESESADEAPIRRKSAVKQKVTRHPACVFI